MQLKVYADRMSQPSRAVIIFCKVNGIQFDEVLIILAKRQQLSSEFKEINPLGKVPTIVDGRLKLFESHAILIYLASAFPSVADHWYPNDLSKRAMIHSVLDWHHTNLRPGAAGYVMNSVLAPFLGRSLDLKAAAEDEKLLTKSLSTLETFWLKGNAKFLLGSNQPSIADLSLVCELMQLQVLEEKDRVRLFSPHKKVEEWIENTRKATMPHFDVVHKTLYGAKEKVEKQRKMGTASKPEINPLGLVPAIADDRLELFESHAILTYLASAYSSVDDHWYPNDLSKRAKTHSVLDWHHTNLRPGATAEAEKLLTKSLSTLETLWLKDNAKFLLGSDQPSIADLSLVCELTQLQLLDENDRLRLLSPRKKVEEWIENTRKATMPHFDLVHETLFGAKEYFEKQRKMGTVSEM